MKKTFSFFDVIEFEENMIVFFFVDNYFVKRYSMFLLDLRKYIYFCNC